MEVTKKQGSKMILKARHVTIMRLSLILVITLMLSGCVGEEKGSSSSTVLPSASVISSITPTNNDLKVSVNLEQITVNFNKPIDASSVNATSFTVNNGLSGTITVTNNNTRIIFVPDSQLESNSTYTVTLFGITDNIGLPVAPDNSQTYSWSFNTCGVTPLSTYTISWTPVSDSDLSGYKVYYGKNYPLTKGNSTNVSIGNFTNWDVNPTNLNLYPCDNLHVAITATGSIKAESQLSQSGTITIE